MYTFFFFHGNISGKLDFYQREPTFHGIRPLRLLQHFVFFRCPQDLPLESITSSILLQRCFFKYPYICYSSNNLHNVCLVLVRTESEVSYIGTCTYFFGLKLCNSKSVFSTHYIFIVIQGTIRSPMGLLASVLYSNGLFSTIKRDKAPLLRVSR